MKYIFGRHPVIEALKSGLELEQIYIQYGTHGKAIDEIKRLAKKENVKLSQISPAKFKEMGKDNNTQGVIGVKSDIRYYELDELLESSKKKNKLFLILDSIQDPHNLGAILRTAECCGVDGVLVTTFNSCPINETVVKTSAGAVSYLKIAKVNNLSNAIKYLKDNGFWFVGTKLGAGKNYNEIDYNDSIAIVMGNEEKGIRRKISEHCDFLVEIPMQGKIQSLNVSVATGVMLFEAARQRNFK